MEKKYRILLFSMVFFLSLYVVWVFVFALPLGHPQKRAYLDSSKNRILLAALHIKGFYKEQNRFPVSLKELSGWSEEEFFMYAPPTGSLKCRLFMDDGSPIWYRVLFPLVYEEKKENRERAEILYNPPSSELSVSPDESQRWALLSPYVCKTMQLGGKVRWGLSEKDLVHCLNNPIRHNGTVKDFHEQTRNME
ncbi:MAG: hypothetical protein RRC34_16940 [Lentisphaeria bacterium]|nr:hypothetical protein [Lentisphaeria bacterium]